MEKGAVVALHHNHHKSLYNYLNIHTNKNKDCAYYINQPQYDSISREKL